MSLSAKIGVALILGLVVGLFFGELAAPLKVGGDAFVLLLQMTVLPYVSLSLIAGLGCLKPKGAARLARVTGSVLLVLWGIALTVVFLIPLAFPSWKSASFFSSSLVQTDTGFDFLTLFIPANPFHSLSESIVPSVVTFSVALGVALIGVERKGTLIDTLETLREGLSRITNFVVGLAPYGVFAIASHAAGTLSLDQAASLQVYMLTYAVCALVLGLWTLPSLVAAITPWSWREIVTQSRAVLITAFATGSVFVVLAVLAVRGKEIVSRLDAELEQDEETTDEEEQEEAEREPHIIDVVIPVAFTFPSVGKLLSLGFVLFAGWTSGYALSPSQYPTLAAAGVSSYFGSTMVAVPFLLDLFQIPSDTFQLFLVADNIVGTRFGAMVAAMHLLSLSLLGVAAMSGQLQLSVPRLVRYAVLTAAFTLLPIIGIRTAFEAIGHEYQGYDQFVSMRTLLPEVESKVYREGPPPENSIESEDLSRPTIERIRGRGVLRVGYTPDRLPWVFTNDEAKLVGFDVEMANSLASELGVTLEMIMAARDEMSQLLNEGRVDVVMSGITLTTNRLEEVTFSQPYVDETIAFIVRDHRREDFASTAAIKGLEKPKIAAPDSPYYLAKLRRYIPQAEITVLDSPRQFFRAKRGTYDAFLFTAESGAAYSLVYPEFTVSVPQPDILKVPLAYAVRFHDDDMARLLSAWIELKRRDRTIDRLFDHWILGKATQDREPRWSIIRDVLGWVE
jgi:Na+/H+-dicarboxylate symporter